MQIVADNIQITNKKIEKALNDMDALPIQELASQCKNAGADAIDLNSGPLLKQAEKKMTFLVNVVQEIVDMPLLLDTSNPSAIHAGLKACKENAVINGFSLEPAKLKNILPLAREFNCKIIGYLLDKKGMVPPNADERMRVAIQLYEEFSKLGLKTNQLVIDPVVVPIMWQDGPYQAMEVLDVIKTLPDLLGFPVQTIIGLSNLTTTNGPKTKKLIVEEAFLSMLAVAGLSMVLMNINHQRTISMAKTCNTLIKGGIFSWEEILQGTVPQ